MKIFLILFFSSAFICQGQVTILRDTIIKIHEKGTIDFGPEKILSLVMSDGKIVTRGTVLSLGKGSLPNGDFNYIATPSNTPAAKLSSKTELKGVTVREIRKKGSKLYGYKYVILVNGNYLLQLEDAVATGEIKM